MIAKPRLAVLLALCLLESCGDEDRLLIVSCQPEPHRSIGVELQGSTGSAFGMLNTRQYGPGTLIQLVAGGRSEGIDAGYPRYLLRVQPDDLSPSRAQNWMVPVLDADLGIRTDADVITTADSVGINLQRLVNRNTYLGVWQSASFQALRKPLVLLNSDPRALAIMSDAGAGSRFILVWATSHGSGISPWYQTSGSSDVFLVKVARFNLHVTYQCPAVDLLNSFSPSPPAGTFFFYIPVKYFPDGTIRVDSRSPRLHERTLFLDCVKDGHAAGATTHECARR